MNKKLTPADITKAASELNVQEAWIKAFIQKEVKAANREGFMSDGIRPTILFERHVFHKLTGGIYSKQYPDISNKTPGGYGKYNQQHNRLGKAAILNREAALQSASWGLFQIMAFQWKDLGYKSLQAFINDMYKSEAKQLEAFVKFIKWKRIDRHMRANNFQEVARLYNGTGYRKNNYDVDLKKYFLQFGGKL